MCSYIFLLIGFFVACSIGSVGGAFFFLGMFIFMIYRTIQKNKKAYMDQVNAAFEKNGEGESEEKKEGYIQLINEQKREMKRKISEFNKPLDLSDDDSFELKAEDLVDVPTADDKNISLVIENKSESTVTKKQEFSIDKKYEMPNDPFAETKKEEPSPSSNWHIDDGFDAKDTFNAKDTFGSSDSFGSFTKKNKDL